MNEMVNCSVCNTPIEKTYCSNCGQRYSAKKITVLTLIADFVSSIFSLEKSGLATILKVIKNPRPIVENYCNGFKNYYASPGRLLLYALTIGALHVAFVDERILFVTLDSEIDGERAAPHYLFWAIFAPVFLCISGIVFMRKKIPFVKHLISLTYVACSWFIVITVVNDILILTVGDMLNVLAFVIFSLLIFMWNSRVLSKKRKPIYIVLNGLLQFLVLATFVAFLIWKTSK